MKLPKTSTNLMQTLPSFFKRVIRDFFFQYVVCDQGRDKGGGHEGKGGSVFGGFYKRGGNMTRGGGFSKFMR